MNGSFDIKFDYRFDRAGFFNDTERREVLEQAAQVWEDLIQEDLPDVPAGIELGVFNPIDGRITQITLNEPIDDLLIFVGAEATPFGGSASFPHGRGCACRLCCPPPPAKAEADPPAADVQVSPLAQATPTSSSTVGSIFRNRFDGANFTPWSGSISFNDSPTFSDGSTAEWFFETTPEPEESIPNGSVDFFSTALHEIGHVLGIGTASIFQEIGAGSNFNGENALSLTEGEGVSLTSDLSHIDPQFENAGEPSLMQPVIPGRVFPSQVELAILADIGWEIEGFTVQGEIPPLATTGDDVIRGTILTDVISGFEGDDQVQGERGEELIFGGSGDDQLSGEEDSDHLRGEAGNDELFGGGGKDYLLGGEDADVVIGEEDNDVLLGNSGLDELQGQTGNDVLFGGEDNDVLFGGEDNDWLAGGSGDDELKGDAGNNWLVGEAGDDLLLGGDGDDYLLGGAGADQIQGAQGNDIIIGGSGEDSLFGQAGNDTFVFLSNSGTDRINDFEIDREIIEISAEYGLTAEAVLASVTKPFTNISRFTLSPEDSIEVAHEPMTGTPLTVENFRIIDFLQEAVKVGSLENDILEVTAVNEIAFSGFGDDLINFSAFSENSVSHRIYGGAGEDMIFANQGNRIFGGAGNDFLNAVLGSGNNRLYGGNGDDWLVGGNNDTLIGGSGSDRLEAGQNNTLFGGEDADQFVLGLDGEMNEETVIADFALDVDEIILANLTFEDLTLVPENNNTRITTEAGTLAIFLNVEATRLNASDFLSTNGMPN